MKGGTKGLYLWGDCAESRYNLSSALDMTYDSSFEEITSLGWHPWVGKSYGQCRMMVLCESHYSSKDTQAEIEKELPVFVDDRFATRKIVAEYLVERRSHNPTFDNVQKFVSGDPGILSGASRKRRVMVWSRLAFMNVIQRPMAFIRKGSLDPAMNERPKISDYQEGADAVLGVVQRLRPRLCCVGSTQSMTYLKDSAKKSGMSVMNEIASKVGRFKAYSFDLVDDRGVVSFRTMRQPGSYFSWRAWRKHVFHGFDDIASRLVSI